MRKGKFNLVDVFVIIAVLLLIGAVVWYLFFKDETISFSGGNDTPITFTVRAYELNPDSVDQIEIGAKLVALDVYQPGEVVDFYTEPSKTVEAINGELVVVEDPTLVDLTVTMTVIPNRQKAYVDLGDQQIVVGYPYWIKTDAMHADGIIIDIVEGE